MQKQLKFTEDGFQVTKPEVSGQNHFPQRNTSEDLQHPNKTDALQTQGSVSLLQPPVMKHGALKAPTLRLLVCESTHWTIFVKFLSVVYQQVLYNTCSTVYVHHRVAACGTFGDA